MDIRNLKGSIVALVTPFNADGSVNFEKMDEKNKNGIDILEEM